MQPGRLPVISLNVSVAAPQRSHSSGQRLAFSCDCPPCLKHSTHFQIPELLARAEENNRKMQDVVAQLTDAVNDLLRQVEDLRELALTPGVARP
jgi:hypothetical protein